MDRLLDRTWRFGEFELDAALGRLKMREMAVPIERRPLALLVLLLEQGGQLVTRNQIAERLWPAGLHVETEMGVNTAIRKLRRALGDQVQQPRFIETVPGRGYRFMQAVQAVETPVASRVTIGVLPFENLGASPDIDYLADGLTEETIASLGLIDPAALAVIGRTTMMSFKATRRTLAEIGQELSAGYLLESSVRTEGGRLRIVVRLIRVGAEQPVWAKRFDAEPDSLLNFQESLARTIAAQISMQLSPSRSGAIARRQTENAQAYDLYLRGRYSWNMNTPQTSQRAIDYYHQATSLDLSYALAWSGIADVLAASPINGDAPPGVVRGPAQKAIACAVAAGPGLAEVQASVGFVRFWLDWDWSGAERSFREAARIDPNYAFAHRMLGVALSHLGQHGEALDAIRVACELDPLFAMHHALASEIAYQSRDFDLALRSARHATIVNPRFWIGHYQVAQAYEGLGRARSALEALEQGARFDQNSKLVALRGYILGRLGEREQALEIAAGLASLAASRFMPPYATALIHAGLDDAEAGFEWLHRACEVRDVHLAFLPMDAKWDRLRADPRFDALLAQCDFWRGDGQTGLRAQAS